MSWPLGVPAPSSRLQHNPTPPPEHCVPLSPPWQQRRGSRHSFLPRQPPAHPGRSPRGRERATLPGTPTRACGTRGWPRLLGTGRVTPGLVSRRRAGWRGGECSAVGYRGVTCPWQGEGRWRGVCPWHPAPPGPARAAAGTSAPPPSSLHIGRGHPQLQPRSTSSLPVLLLLLLKQVPSVLKKKKNTQNPVP